MLRGVNGSGGGAPVGGSGTANTIAVWTGTGSTLGNSGITDNGTTVSFVSRNLSSTAAQTWTLTSSTSALNIASGLLNLDTSGGNVSSTFSTGADISISIKNSGAGRALFAADAGGTSASEVRFRQGGVDKFRLIANGGTSFSLYDSTASAYRWFVDSSGNVGIGTASPGYRLHVKDATNRNMIMTSGTTGMKITSLTDAGAEADIGVQGNTVQFLTGGTERARIDSTGNFILNTVTTGATIQAAGTQQGLKLPATPGNADTQTLDCYAEGTYTPTTTGFGGTVSSATGVYTRIGRMVFCEVLLNGTAMTASYGTSIVSAPFTIAAGCASTVQGQSPVGYGIGATSPSSTQLYVPTMVSASTMRFTCTYFV